MDTLHLVGAEVVERAGQAIAGAATEMERAARNVEGAFERHARFLDEWLAGFQTALELAARPTVTMNNVSDPTTRVTCAGCGHVMASKSTFPEKCPNCGAPVPEGTPEGTALWAKLPGQLSGPAWEPLNQEAADYLSVMTTVREALRSAILARVRPSEDDGKMVVETANRAAEAIGKVLRKHGRI